MILDYLMTILLVVTIIYCWKLHVRISKLQRNKNDFLKHISELNRAIIGAEAGIAELKRISTDMKRSGKLINNELQRNITQGNYLASDLKSLLNQANQLSAAPSVAQPAVHKRQSTPSGLSSDEIAKLKQRINTELAQSDTKEHVLKSLLDQIATAKSSGSRGSKQPDANTVLEAFKDEIDS